MNDDPEYIAWERQAPSELRADVIWTLDVYRYALFAAWLAHRDASRLLEAPLGRSLADQLLRAAESTSARLAEGDSRFHVRDRARYFEYALGSARETRDHYVKAIPMLGPEIGRARIALHSRITQMLIRLVANCRAPGPPRRTPHSLPDDTH